MLKGWSVACCVLVANTAEQHGRDNDFAFHRIYRIFKSQEECSLQGSAWTLLYLNLSYLILPTFILSYPILSILFVLFSHPTRHNYLTTCTQYDVTCLIRCTMALLNMIWCRFVLCNSTRKELGPVLHNFPFLERRNENTICDLWRTKKNKIILLALFFIWWFHKRFSSSKGQCDSSSMVVDV